MAPRISRSALVAPLFAVALALIMGCEWISGFDGARAATTTDGGTSGGTSGGPTAPSRCASERHRFCLDFEPGGAGDRPFERDVGTTGELLEIVEGGANGSARALHARIPGLSGQRRALLRNDVAGDFRPITIAFDFRSLPASWPGDWVGTTIASVTFFSGKAGPTERVYVGLTIGPSDVRLFAQNRDQNADDRVMPLPSTSAQFTRLVLRVSPGAAGRIEVEHDGVRVYERAVAFAVTPAAGASTQFAIGLIRGSGAGADLEAYYDDVAIDRPE
jgi:hypothetical protein